VGKCRTHTPQPAVSIWPAEHLLAKPASIAALCRARLSARPAAPLRPCAVRVCPRRSSVRLPQSLKGRHHHTPPIARRTSTATRKPPIAHAVGNPSAATAAATLLLPLPPASTASVADDLAVSLATAQSPCFRTQKQPTPSTPSSQT
jgi:hypothetical protein